MHTFLIAAISADGYISQREQQASTSWTSQEDKQFFQVKTKQAGLIVMGRKTFATIGFPLPGRMNVIYTRQSQPDLVKEFGLSQQQQQHLRVTNLPPAQLIQELDEEGYQQLAVCGGSSIYTQFVQSGVVDEYFLTVEPVIFGDGVPLFNARLKLDLELVATKTLNQQGSLLLTYRSAKAQEDDKQL